MQFATRFLVMAASLLGFAPAAFAGDYADREIIGFSPDGATFAFEEYGVGDGSGFPYSNIYVIDVDQDAWLDGTPIHVMIESEEAPLAAARTESRRRAKPILDKYRTGNPGVLAVSNPQTELSGDPYSVRFLTNPYIRSDDRRWTLTLTGIPFAEAGECENLGPVQGFRLVLTSAQGFSRTLHEDASLPASRGCAQDYALADVLLFSPDRAEPVLVALLRKYSMGFEGADGRYIAVAVRLEPPLSFSN
jgi:predicted secreted protein